MVLYIDACVRKNSRTRRLADCLLNTLNAPYTRLRLEECVFPTVDEAFLEKRDRLLREGDFDNPSLPVQGSSRKPMRSLSQLLFGICPFPQF